MASANVVETVLETYKEANSLLSQVSNKTFENCEATVDLETVTEQLEEIREMKVQAKDKFEDVLTRHFFLESLSAPPSDWPSLTTLADDELQSAKSNLKKAKQLAEDQKNKVLQLNAVVVQGSSLYQRQIDNLKEKTKTLEDLIEEIRTAEKALIETGGGDSLVAKELKEQCSELEKLAHESRKELLQAEHHKAQLEAEVTSLQSSLRQLRTTLDEDQETMDANCLARLQKSIKDIETISDIKCYPQDSNTVVVEFPPRTPSLCTSSKTGAGQDGGEVDKDLVLKVTMSFKGDELGYLQLASMESSVNSFDVEDLWEEHSQCHTSSLSQLVSRIKARWLSHVPLLSEINSLRCRFAIDWIQKENVLRVMVGKGGGVVCSLNIPPSYPHEGQVTLSSITGAADYVELENLQPQTGTRLGDWVQHLENTFGKP